MPRIQTKEELEAQLVEQLRFLERSCEAFDEGDTAEAKRLAATLRVLLHDDGRHSRSLLGQLGRLSTLQFCDSAHPDDPTNFGPNLGILQLVLGGTEGTRMMAPLDGFQANRRECRYVDFQTWWSADVLRGGKKARISRCELVLRLANQDGGVHVDPALDDEYAALSRDNSLGMHAGHAAKPESLEPIAGLELHAVRQITHEVLKTLRPEYAKDSVPGDDTVIISGLGLHITNSDNQPVIRPTRRNAPCPCGSGKKFKKCHGAPRLT